MRQKRIKDVEIKTENYKEWIIDEPEKFKGKWKEVFGNENPLFLEIGCGKGQFITTHAKNAENLNFIAVEGNPSALYRALQKMDDFEEENLRFLRIYVDDIRDIFAENELEGMYLNFSDPWPKERHAKRRLTFGKKLMQYGHIIKEGGCLEFKTDNDDLFEFTLEQIEECGLNVTEMTRDLHNSPYAEGNITTEYEDKFSETGKNINYVKIQY